MSESLHFPSDPNSRRVIVALDEHDVERWSMDEATASSLYDAEVHVLRLPLQGDIKGRTPLGRLARSGLARHGRILVQDPYDKDKYCDQEDIAWNAAISKMTLFSTFCSHLGAKSVTVERITSTSSSATWEFTAEGGFKSLGGDAKVGREAIEKLSSRISLKDIFTGTEPNLAAAEQLLGDMGLEFEPSFTSLLELKRSANPIKSRTLAISLTDEAQRNLEVAARIRFPKISIGAIGIGASLKLSRHTEESLAVSATIKF